MQITVTDNRKIFQLQEEFTQCFPYLKIEVLSKPHKSWSGTSERILRSAEKTIGDYRKGSRDGNLTISGNMTVTELERQFRELYGLHVLVFRKSGKVWLETTVTDGWTLAEQNNQGEALSALIAVTRCGNSARI